MKDIKGCLSHNSDHWSTPSKLYNAFIDLGFNDPCPLHAEFDGLLRNYEGKKIFVNPPFSSLDKWCDWCIKQVQNNNDIWLLMPARTDTKYFAKLVKLHPTIVFLEGRLHFNDTKKVAPFPTILLNLRKFYFLNIFSHMTLDTFIDNLYRIYGKR